MDHALEEMACLHVAKLGCSCSQVGHWVSLDLLVALGVPLFVAKHLAHIREKQEVLNSTCWAVGGERTEVKLSLMAYINALNALAEAENLEVPSPCGQRKNGVFQFTHDSLRGKNDYVIT